MRRFLVSLIVLCVWPAAAHAAPRPLTEIADTDGFALAGDLVLYSKTVGQTFQVRSIPVAGGAARTVYRYSVPPGWRLYSVILRATPERAAALVYFGDADGAVIGSQLLSGPPDGSAGWTAITQPTRLWTGSSVALNVQVDEGLLFTEEARTNADDVTAVVREPEPRDLPYRTGITVFAGDLVAVSAQAPDQFGDEIGRRVVIANWRTGAQLGMSELPDPLSSIALRSDGRVAASTIESSVYTFMPGQAPARLGAGVGNVAFAGDHIVFQRAHGGLGITMPGVAPHAFGIPTKRLGGVSGDEHHVLWSANGCLLVADPSDAPAVEPGPGPCGRSELAVPEDQQPRLHGRFRIIITCVAASAAGCRDTVRLRSGQHVLGRRTRIDLTAGRTRTLSVRLSTRDVARLRRAGSVTVETGNGRTTELRVRD